MGTAFQQAVELLLSTLFAFFLALMGGLVRLLHERAHGLEFSWPRGLLVVASAIVLGVLGQATGEYLSNHYGLPALTSGALAGFLGYLGPTFLDTLAELAIKKARGEKSEDEDDAGK